eukprot:Awhi_evm1s10225
MNEMGLQSQFNCCITIKLLKKDDGDWINPSIVGILAGLFACNSGKNKVYDDKDGNDKNNDDDDDDDSLCCSDLSYGD